MVERFLRYDVTAIDEIMSDEENLATTVTIVFDAKPEPVAIRLQQKELALLEATLAKLRAALMAKYGPQ